jgi:hypothetical protein
MVLHRSAAGSFTPLWRTKALVGACISVSLCTSSAVAHDWYTGLVDPITGNSCCGGQDCRPVPREDVRLGQDGDLELFLDGAWRHADPRTILKISSPDSRVHACWFHLFQELRCVILPGTL